MLTHAQIWNALDRLAARAKLSPSGLAKRAGLDPTTFNRSKRITPDGRARWPSTESVAKALAATGTGVETFVSLISDSTGVAQAVPLIGFAEAGSGGYFDDGGFPVGKGWDEIAFPAVNDEHAYALEISGDPCCRPTATAMSSLSRLRLRSAGAVVSWCGPRKAKCSPKNSSGRRRIRSNSNRSMLIIPTARLRWKTCCGLRASCGRVSSQSPATSANRRGRDRQWRWRR